MSHFSTHLHPNLGTVARPLTMGSFFRLIIRHVLKGILFFLFHKKKKFYYLNNLQCWILINFKTDYKSKTEFLRSNKFIYIEFCWYDLDNNIVVIDRINNWKTQTDWDDFIISSMIDDEISVSKFLFFFT
jgi:hypothetical protein